MDYLVVSLVAMIALVPYFLFALALLVLGKFLFDWSTPHINDDRELSERDNPAFAALFAGYMLGLSLALAGSFFEFGPSIVTNFLDIGASGLAAIILLRLSMLLGERLVFSHLSLEREIVEDRNLGAGFGFAGLLVANGLVIGAVMTGKSASTVDMFIDIGVYWLLGQVFLLVAWFLFRVIARFDLRKEIIEADNAAAGLSLGGFLIGVGIVLAAALRGAGSDRGPELLTASVLGVVGLILLAAGRLLSATVLFRNARLAAEESSHRNIAAGAVSALASVAVAILFAALVGSQLG